MTASPLEHKLGTRTLVLVVIYVVSGVISALVLAIIMSGLFNISGDDLLILGLIVLVPFIFMILNTANNDYFSQQTKNRG